MIDNKKEVIERILDDFGFVVKWKYEDYFANVTVYEVTAIDEDDSPLFNKNDWKSLPDPVGTLEEAEIYLEGRVKWDGCSDFDRESYHWCGVDGYVKHVKLLRYIHKRAFELMDREPDGEWLE